jgi:hypothetical protein
MEDRPHFVPRVRPLSHTCWKKEPCEACREQYLAQLREECKEAEERASQELEHVLTYEFNEQLWIGYLVCSCGEQIEVREHDVFSKPIWCPKDFG